MKQVFHSLFISLLFISASYASNDLNFIDPWIPEAPPGARVLAGFMEIQNTGNQNIIIQQVSSPSFKSVEMHLSTEANGIASMQQQKTLTVAANSKLTLKSGSYHLMLIKPQKKLHDGDKVLLRFKLSNEKTIEQIVPVKKASGKKKASLKCASGKCGAGKCGGGK